MTIDAMGTQREIAKTIIEQKADYVLSLKGNQGNLHKNVELFFQAFENKDMDVKDINVKFHQTMDKGHGRIEERKYWVTSDISWLDPEKKWKGLNSIAMCKATRIIGDSISNEISHETRFFISSLPDDAELFARAIRSHWRVENSLHWVLDISFREDDCRIRQGFGPENFAVLRHISLNLLKQESSLKLGIKAKRLKAAWDSDYLLKVLNF